MFKIGDIEIKNQVIAAPMAGISSSAYRVTVKEMGAGLVVCEMISDKGIQFRNEKTLRMLHIEPNEYPLSIQIMGGNKDTLVAAAKYVAANTDCSIIDINMGCPVSKVIKNEAGAKWLLDPEKVYEMVAAVVDAVDKPVTVKMRLGWDDRHLFAVENALAAERAGASAVAMHGRTRVQMYEGKADWAPFKEVKRALTRIPFIGNGDVRSPEDAKRMIDDTGVDGVMIGRAALSNPFIIRQTTHYLETGELLPQVSTRGKLEITKTHLNRLVELKGEKSAVKEFRSIAPYYLKGIPRSSKTKAAIAIANKQQEINDLLDRFVEETEQREEEKSTRKESSSFITL